MESHYSRPSICRFAFKGSFFLFLPCGVEASTKYFTRHATAVYAYGQVEIEIYEVNFGHDRPRATKDRNMAGCCSSLSLLVLAIPAQTRRILRHEAGATASDYLLPFSVPKKGRKERGASVESSLHGRCPQTHFPLRPCCSAVAFRVVCGHRSTAQLMKKGRLALLTAILLPPFYSPEFGEWGYRCMPSLANGVFV